MTSAPAEMRTRSFWRLMAYAAVLGVVGAIAGMLFLGVTGIGASWYGDPGLDWVSGPIWWVARVRGPRARHHPSRDAGLAGHQVSP